MNKEFIPYEEALALKELGFDEPCFAGYSEDEHGIMLCLMNILSDGLLNNPEDEHCECLAPLYQQAFRWFRENYKLHSTITSVSQESWQWHITKPGESLGKLYNEDFYTYEEAELECLRQIIKIVKDKE
jgi:hypothetical protein